jgi:ketosteroid isomerase-like protein
LSDTAAALSADRAWIRAMCEADIGTLDRLLSADLVFVNADGKRDNKASLIAAMLSGALAFRRIETTEMLARCLGDGAVLSGTCRLETSSYGRRAAATVRFAAVWGRHAAGWHLVHWQATPAPDDSTSR